MKPKGNKKILLYAGIAGAVIALVVLLKKKQSGSSEEGAGATYASAPSGIPAYGEGAGAGTSALGTQLGEWERGFTSQLPAAIEQGVQSGLKNNQTGQTSTPSWPEIIASLGVFATAIRGGGTGEQIGSGSQGSPSSAAPAVQPAVQPASPPPPAAAPPVVSGQLPQPTTPAPPTWTPITCGNGCPGHRHSNGSSACMIKDHHGHCYWP